MDIITSPEQMQATALALRRTGQPIGLVPTMGFLHAGHLALVKLARQAFPAASSPTGKTTVALSIFVNPIQFGPNDDFNRYPRNFDKDCRLCEQEGVDIIFHPSVESMYLQDLTAFVEETALSKGLCGSSRPGHFRGVLTVVAKLFNLLQPQVAVFGEKDAQQVRLIQQMVRDLNFPIRIVFAPIVRDPDGLAMSSRNTYLSSAERHAALCLVQSLQLARNLYRQGERNAAKIIPAMTRKIREVPATAIDYIEIVNNATLQPVRMLNGAVLIALAVRIGKTRLIDNLMLPDDHLCQIPE